MLASCNKDDAFVPVKRAEEPILFPIDSNHYDGMMLAIRTDKIPANTIPDTSFIDMVLAQFYNPGLVSVGNVRLNDKLLLPISSQYISNHTILSYELAAGTQNKWTIQGDNGIAGFTKKLNTKMPGFIHLNSVPQEIDLSQSITLQIENVPANSQAIVWSLIDINGNQVQKETTGTTVTWTKEELQSLSPGLNSLLKVAAYTKEVNQIGSRKYLFLNETTDVVDISLK